MGVGVGRQEDEPFSANDTNLLDEFDPNKEIHEVLKELEEEYKHLNR